MAARSVNVPTIKRKCMPSWLGAVLSGVISFGLPACSDEQLSRAVVRGGALPGMVATDLDAFKTLYSPSPTSAVVDRLVAGERAFSVAQGTACKVVGSDRSTCSGNHSALQVRLLDGPRLGQDVWICSDGIRMSYRWP